MFKNVQEAIAYIEQKRTKRTFLQFVETIQKYHFDTHQKQTIHIAGTNGKGSTTNYVKQILMHHGYRVGTFTSPYMVTHNDRICINGEPISDKELLHYIEQLYPIIEQEQLSMFEIDVLIMLQYFKEQELDFRIIETGIGGLYDKTNVVDSTLSAITNIGYDHQFMLGETLLEIAGHKAGIIKEKQIFVTSESKSEILQMFRSLCLQKETKMIEVDNEEGYTFTFDNHRYMLKDCGSYQVHNAKLALTIANECISLEPKKVQQALSCSAWPGRFERIGNMYLDGAHNVDGMKALLQTIQDLELVNVGIIFSALGDKDVELMLAVFKDYPICIAGFEDDRFCLKDTMDYKEALLLANSRYDTIIVTGSLHFISIVRKYLKSL